jgi:hypothetical protein
MGTLRFVPRLMGALVNIKAYRQNACLPAFPWTSLQNPTLLLSKPNQVTQTHRIDDTETTESRTRMPTMAAIQISFPTQTAYTSKISSKMSGCKAEVLHERDCSRKSNIFLLYSINSLQTNLRHNTLSTPSYTLPCFRRKILFCW